MKIRSIKTCKIRPYEYKLFEILEKYLPKIRKKSIVVITSKIVAICEGKVKRREGINKRKLIESEAEYILPLRKNKYNITLTLKRNILIPTAGIDESNGDGFYILWPGDPQKAANQIRKFLCEKFKINDIGIIITDSKTTPLRKGTTGIAIAHSGFEALNNYVGQPDIFGKKLIVTNSNVLDALAASAVLIMGEGKEQTPLAIIEDVPFVKFQSRNPSTKELDDLKISLKDDLYAPLLTSVKWRKCSGKAFDLSR